MGLGLALPIMLASLVQARTRQLPVALGCIGLQCLFVLQVEYTVTYQSV